MKACWDIINEIKYNKKKKTFSRKGHSLLLIECKNCREDCFVRKGSNFCTRKCSKQYKEYKEKMSEKIKSKWKDQNSTYNSDEFRKRKSVSVSGENNPFYGKHHAIDSKNRLSMIKKNQWKDQNSIYNSDDHKKKRSIAIKRRWKDKEDSFNSNEYREKKSNITKENWSKGKYNRDFYVERMSGINSPNWKGYKNIPLYDTYAHQIDWIEDCRKNEEDQNILEVKCAYCGRWYVPTLNNIYRRIQHLKGNGKYSENRFYCSDGCKQECPIYGKKPETLMKEDAIRAGRLNWIELNREVQPELRQLVLKRDGYTCQKCGSTEHLHCHHILPASIEPIESADMDNCITLCKGCHAQVHKQDGCKYGQLRNCING